MANPLSALEGEIQSVVHAQGLNPDGSARIERLELHTGKEVIAVPNIDVPADLKEQFRVGAQTRLALFGAPTVRSRFVGGTFDSASYIRLPENLQKMRTWVFGVAVAIDAAALFCVYFWHLWGAVPGLVLGLLSLGPWRMGRALPSFRTVKALVSRH